MKKVYIAPQTEALELLGANAIMVGSGYKNPNLGMGSGSYDGPGE